MVMLTMPGPGMTMSSRPPETLAIMAARYGAGFATGTTPLAYHQPFDIGDARVTLVPPVMCLAAHRW